MTAAVPKPATWFRYDKAAALDGLDRVTLSRQCVALVQAFVPAIGPTAGWKPGPRVQDLKPGSIPVGTVIATFWNGAYPKDRSRGKHAAFYLGHDAAGIAVVEQWAGATPKQAKAIRGGKGVIRFKGITLPADQSGPSPDMGNIGEYYRVVLDLRPAPAAATATASA